MWLYEGKEFSPDESELSSEDIYGFVYLITNEVNGRKYIGKKFLWRNKTLPVTKTRKRKKKVKVLSDWKTYYGSSEELRADVEKYGRENFTRTILHLCKTKGECAYFEAKEQFLRDVLYDPSYYNSWISLKVHSKHLKLDDYLTE